MICSLSSYFPKVVALRQELTKMQAIAERAQGTWDKFRKERDFHRMHHKRVVQVRRVTTPNSDTVKGLVNIHMLWDARNSLMAAAAQIAAVQRK